MQTKTKAQEIETLAKLVAGTYDCPYLNEALRIVEAQFKQDITSDFITVISIRDSTDARIAAQTDLQHVAAELRAAKAELVQLKAQITTAQIQREEARNTLRQLGQRLQHV